MISSISENVAKIVLVLIMFVTKLKKEHPKKCLCACDLCVCVFLLRKNFEFETLDPIKTKFHPCGRMHPKNFVGRPDIMGGTGGTPMGEVST